MRFSRFLAERFVTLARDLRSRAAIALTEAAGRSWFSGAPARSGLGPVLSPPRKPIFEPFASVSTRPSRTSAYGLTHLTSEATEGICAGAGNQKRMVAREGMFLLITATPRA